MHFYIVPSFQLLHDLRKRNIAEHKYVLCLAYIVLWVYFADLDIIVFKYSLLSGT